MNELEIILDKADFSAETIQKNQLYYELFHKPVPVIGRKMPLNEAALGFVAGGKQEPEQKKEGSLPGENRNED